MCQGQPDDLRHWKVVVVVKVGGTNYGVVGSVGKSSHVYLARSWGARG